MKLPNLWPIRRSNLYVIFCKNFCWHLHSYNSVNNLGSTRQMVEGKLQRDLLRLDSCESFTCIRRIGTTVSKTIFSRWSALLQFIVSLFAFSYGLPVNFQAILLHPNKKSTKRLRDVLNQLYSHLDGSAQAPTNIADVSHFWKDSRI